MQHNIYTDRPNSATARHRFLQTLQARTGEPPKKRYKQLLISSPAHPTYISRPNITLPPRHLRHQCLGHFVIFLVRLFCFLRFIIAWFVLSLDSSYSISHSQVWCLIFGLITLSTRRYSRYCLCKLRRYCHQNNTRKRKLYNWWLIHQVVPNTWLSISDYSL